MSAHPPEPSFDGNGYPTKETLQAIREWQPPFGPLMAYVRLAWQYAEWGWSQDGDTYTVSTGGWSGNEDPIGALRENLVFWALCWQEHRRGGHYVFIVKEPAGSANTANVIT